MRQRAALRQESMHNMAGVAGAADAAAVRDVHHLLRCSVGLKPVLPRGRGGAMNIRKQGLHVLNTGLLHPSFCSAAA